MLPRAALVAAALGVTAWACLVITAPLLPTPLAGAVYAAGALVCHQIAARSFHLAGAQLAVCARCVGIDVGASLALVWLVARGRRFTPEGDAAEGRVMAARAWLAAGALPTAVTVGAERAGLWFPSNATRGVSGVLLGVAVAVVAAGAATLHYRPWVEPRRGRTRPPRR